MTAQARDLRTAGRTHPFLRAGHTPGLQHQPGLPWRVKQGICVPCLAGLFKPWLIRQQDVAIERLPELIELRFRRARCTPHILRSVAPAVRRWRCLAVLCIASVPQTSDRSMTAISLDVVEFVSFIQCVPISLRACREDRSAQSWAEEPTLLWLMVLR